MTQTKYTRILTCELCQRTFRTTVSTPGAHKTRCPRCGLEMTRRFPLPLVALIAGIPVIIDDELPEGSWYFTGTKKESDE